MPRALSTYESVVGANSISQLQQLASDLKGARVVHVNSTREGGGVAEILSWLTSLMNDLGLDASWETIKGNDGFFRVTKAFHNALQGNNEPLTRRMLETYRRTLEMNAERLRPILQEADFVFIHDPQPAGLFDFCPDKKGIWVWRCHIDASHPNRKFWQYLKSLVGKYDVSVFSMADFAQSLPHPQFLIAPSIDPLSDKNCELSEGEVFGTLQRLGIPDDLPILTQISRFDRFKDPVGVIEAFKLLSPTVHARLVLAGGGASDDPESVAVLDEVRDYANGNGRIHILELPSNAHRSINALQRASAVIIQKSTKEGFGLTVTEAMWKSKPVVGGNVGGIRMQVHNHHTGFLVNTPQGAALRIQELLRIPAMVQRMGREAKAFVTDNFLLDRHLREYLTLMLGVRRGLTNHLIAH